MARRVLVDEFHLSFLAPRNLSPAQFDAIRSALDDARFRALLRRGVKNVVAHFPPLNRVRVRLSR
jgi:hypothetical protein